MTLGSLFDGISAFPLAASRHGIEPLWASEIVAAPIAIAKRHFPGMKQLGDIRGISGAEIEPVDVISFGSPCQDLSVAGKRAGLLGEQSSLFMEAVRAIKEMRGATGIKPRFCAWENVPGAFSSNRGEDFRTVIEEIARIAEPGISIPRPSARGSRSAWRSAGAVLGDGWSLAWRVLDAQYWGIPQRRKRIFLVADFGGGSAGEILFKPEGLRRDAAEGGEAGEGIAADAERGAGAAGQYAVGVTNSMSGRIQMNPRVSATLQSGGGGGSAKTGLYCLPASVHQNQQGELRLGGVANTLNANGNASGRNAPLAAVFCKYRYGEYQEGAGTLRANASATEAPLAVSGYAVRRLTPTECERLMGFPDGWTAFGFDGKPISDTARYRALGNSIAIPCAEFVMGRIADEMRR